MAVNDIKFSTTLISDLYKPIEVVATSSVDGEVEIIVTNYGSSALGNLGVYLSIASNQGDVDNPADMAPHVDYQDLLTWGTESYRLTQDSGTYVPGGVLVYDPVDTSLVTKIRRGKGSDYRTKIPLPELDAGSNYVIKVVLEVPSSVTARRMFADIAVE